MSTGEDGTTRAGRPGKEFLTAPLQQQNQLQQSLHLVVLIFTHTLIPVVARIVKIWANVSALIPQISMCTFLWLSDWSSGGTRIHDSAVGVS